MKKKSLIILLLLSFFTVFMFSAVACGKDGAKDVPLTIDYASIEIVAGENRTIKVSGVTVGQKAVWTSSNEDVVMVIDGRVYGLAEGTATVTVEVGDKNAECTVKVLQSRKAGPTLRFVLQKDKISLRKSSVYPLDAILVYGDEVIETSITYTSDATGVATVDASGSITAVAYGKANIVLKAEYNGVSVVDSVEVNVFERDIEINFEKNDITVCTADNDDTIPNEVSLGAEIVLDGEHWDGEIVWSLEDDEIADISVDGGRVIVQGKKFGHTRLYAEVVCDGEKVNSFVDVAVERATITSAENAFINFAESFSFKLPAETEISSIVSVKDKELRSEFEIERIDETTGMVYLIGEPAYGKRTYIVTSDNYVVTEAVTIASDLISIDVANKAIPVYSQSKDVMFALTGLSVKADYISVNGTSLKNVFFTDDSVIINNDTLSSYKNNTSISLTIKKGSRTLVSDTFSIADFVIFDKASLRAFGDAMYNNTWNSDASRGWTAIMIADVDYGGDRWVDLNPHYLWEGVFDGLGHSISNMQVAFGLFGGLKNGGTVKNVALNNFVIVNTGVDYNTWNDFSGALVSWNYSGTVTNCFAKISSKRTDEIHSGWGSHAGLVGINQSTVTNCIVVADFEMNNTYPAIAYHEAGTYRNNYAYSSDALYEVRYPEGGSSANLYKKKLYLIAAVDFSGGNGWSEFWTKDAESNICFGGKVVVSK